MTTRSKNIITTVVCIGPLIEVGEGVVCESKGMCFELDQVRSLHMMGTPIRMHTRMHDAYTKVERAQKYRSDSVRK